MIKFTEACLLSGTALVICENEIAGFLLIGFSFLAAIGRFSVELQKEKQIHQVQDELIKTAAEWVKDAFIKSNALYGRNSNGNTTH